MKYIKRPEPVAAGNSSLSFEEFISHLVNTDQRFNQSGPGIRAGLRVEDAVSKPCKPGVIELDQDLWRLLHQAAENPSGGYPELISADGSQRRPLGRVCLPFIDAIGAATDQLPDSDTAAKTDT